jgi:hypothetical protein
VAGPSPRQVVLAGEREALLRGRGVQPVSLLPHRNDWDELTRDTVRAVEWGIGSRGFHRPGDVLEVPGSIGYFQFLLRKTGARRRGRDYARTVLAKAQEIGLLRDTGRVLKPRRHPRGEHQYWWRVWSVVRSSTLSLRYPDSPTAPTAATATLGVPCTPQVLCVDSSPVKG